MPSRQDRHPLQPLGAMLLAGLSPLALCHPAQAEEAPAAKQLPTIRVEAEPEAGQAPSPLVTTTRVGKTLQNPQDVPQAITSVPASILREQQAESLKEAMRNVAGVSFNAAEGGRAGDNMNLRGFYTFGDIYLDGIRDTAQYNRETFNLDQIDVLRGAGAMLFGRGQAGGVINQVTKVPKAKTGGELSASVGSQGTREVKADVNVVLSPDAAVRVNAMERQAGSWRENPSTGTEPEVHRQGLAASFAVNQTHDSKFWFNLYKLSTRDIPDYGVRFDSSTAAPNTRQATRNFFGTDQNFDHSDTEMATLINETRLSATQKLRTQFRQAHYLRSYWAKTPASGLTTTPDAQSVEGGNVTRMASYNTSTLQSDYSQRFQLAGMQHEALAGLEWLKEDSSRQSLSNLGGTTSANPPKYLPYVSSLAATTFTGESYAAYAQDTVEFVRDWKLTAGVRRDEMHAKYSSATSPKLHYGENSYRAALSWQPDDQTHYYLGWSDSFSATADLYQLTTVAQPPERSDVVELGAKWLLLDGDLALRTAVYQATKDFERSTDLESTATLLTRKRRTRGVELDVAGRITPDWEVFGGLALMNAKILAVASNYNATTNVWTTGNAGYVGQRARNTPEYTLNLWTTYKVDGNWKVGGGAEAVGDRLGYQPQSANRQLIKGVYSPNTAPSYVRWDAMVHYDKSTWTATLNVKNLLDKVYYDAVYDNGGFVVPGPRREVVLTGTYRF